MRLITAINNLIVINSKTFSKLIFWMIQLLISPYALESRAASNFGLNQIRFRRPWFCLPHYCWENLLRHVYWKILTVSSSLRIIYRVVQCQLSILESSIGNHLLKILIIVLKIVFLLLSTPNALGIDTLGDPIVKMSGTIPVVNQEPGLFSFSKPS